jgi:hypothetical protein
MAMATPASLGAAGRMITAFDAGFGALLAQWIATTLAQTTKQASSGRWRMGLTSSVQVAASRRKRLV